MNWRPLPPPLLLTLALVFAPESAQARGQTRPLEDGIQTVAPTPVPTTKSKIAKPPPESARQRKPTDGQRCEADADVASANYVKCRLDAEAKGAVGALADEGFTAEVALCSVKLSKAFAKMVKKYGVGDCPREPSAAFDEYLAKCADDAAAAAAGGFFPGGGS